MRILIILVILQISMYVSLIANEIVFYQVTGTKVNLRVEPDINSKVLTVLPIGSMASSKNNNYVKAKVGNIEGNWVFVNSGILHTIHGKIVPYEGWVFDYYLYKEGTHIGSKGFERVNKIQLDKNKIELILFEDPKRYNITINQDGTFDVIIKNSSLNVIKAKGQIYRYRSLYMCETKGLGFSFHIDDDKYLVITNIIGNIDIKPSKIKVLEEPVVELIK